MKKYVLLLLFVILFLFSYAGEGEKIFKSDTLIYVEIKTKDVFGENIPEIKAIKKKLDASGINEFFNVDAMAAKNMEIGIFNIDGGTGYVLIEPMTLKEYQASKNYKNPMFAEEVIDGTTLNIVNAGILSFYWEAGIMYISDNKNLLASTINSKKDKKNTLLKNNKNYQTLNLIEKSYLSKIFLNYQIETENFTAENGIVFFTNKNIRKIYSPAIVKSTPYRTVDYSKFVEEKPDKVYLGRENVRIFERIFADIPYFNYKNDKEVEDYFAEEYKHFLIGEKGNRFSIVLYNENGATDEWLINIVKYFNQNILYWKKIQPQKYEGYGYYFELPGIGKRYYWAIKDKYAVFTNDPEYIKNVFFSKYNDINYLRIETSIIYDYDYAGKKARNVFYRDNEVEETISIANAK